MRVGQQISGADLDAIPENPTAQIDNFPCQDVAFHRQIHHIIDVHITSDFSGYPGKRLVRFITVHPVIAGNGIDAQHCFRVQIHRQIVRRLHMLNIVWSIHAIDLGNNMRVFKQIAGQNIQFITQCAIMFR